MAQEVARLRGEAGDLFPRSGGVLRLILWNKCSSETCVCIRGHFEEYFYDENGNLTDTIDMVPGGVVLNIEKGQWHSLKVLESGTVLFEAKDGPYAPLWHDDIMGYDNSAECLVKVM